MKTKTKKLGHSTDDWDEKRFYAEHSMPSMYAGYHAIIPLVLTLPIFSISRANGEVINDVWTRKAREIGGTVRYMGKQLSQSHLTVLLRLAHLRRGDVVDNVITFRPSTFCASIGWSDNSRNKKRLEEILDDLFTAKMKVWGNEETEEQAARVSIVTEWKPGCEATAEWSVYLSPTVLRLFQGHLTRMHTDKRQLLREGMATFLFGFVSAHNCAKGFAYEELHAASGSAGTCGDDFKKDVRKQLDSLKALGIIVNYEQQKNKDTGEVTVRVWKK